MIGEEYFGGWRSHMFCNQISFVVIGYENLFLVANRSGHEADLSLPSSDVVKNEWNCTSTYCHVSMLCTEDFFFLQFIFLRNSQCTVSMVQDVVHLSTVLKGIELRSSFLMLILTIILVMRLRIKCLFYERIHVTPRVYRKLWYRNSSMAIVGSTKSTEQLLYTH